MRLLLYCDIKINGGCLIDKIHIQRHAVYDSRFYKNNIQDILRGMHRETV